MRSSNIPGTLILLCYLSDEQRLMLSEHVKSFIDLEFGHENNKSTFDYDTMMEVYYAVVYATAVVGRREIHYLSCAIANTYAGPNGEPFRRYLNSLGIGDILLTQHDKRA